jgi:hypothetical protein
LKISAAMLAVFTAIRECCARVMRKGRVVPEISSSRAPRFHTFGAKRRAAPKILKTPEFPVCIVIGGAREPLATTMSRKMGRKFTVSPSHRTCVIQNPIGFGVIPFCCIQAIFAA